MATDHIYAQYEDLKFIPEVGSTCEVMDTEAALLLSCEECNLTFENHQKYRKHEQYHILITSNEFTMRIFSCTKCGFMSRNEENLDGHIHEEHAQSENTTSRFVLKAVIPMLFVIKDVQISVNPHEETNQADKTNEQQTSTVRDDREVQQAFPTQLHPKKVANTKPKTTNKRKLPQRIACASKVFSHKRYPCSSCGKVFARKRGLQIHSKVHKRQPSYSCLKCEDRPTFQTLSERTKHTHAAHGQSKRKEKPLCELCGKQFATNTVLQQHRKFVHLQIKKHLCSNCGKTFNTKFFLQEHEQRVHGTEALFVCDVCGKRFKVPRQLREHRKRHYNLQRYTCEVCGCKFSEKTNCKRHMQIHEGLAYCCQVCGKSYARKYYLMKHLTTHGDNLSHDSVKRVVVPVSETRRIKQRMMDEEEQNDVHYVKVNQEEELPPDQRVSRKGKRLYDCDICGKSFTSSNVQQRHRFVHFKDVKLFKCSHCDKSFHTKIILRQHLETHNTEVKYKCLECGKGFKTGAGWHTHKYVHKAICRKCKVCGKIYRGNSAKVHIRKAHQEELSRVSHWKYLCERVMEVQGKSALEEDTSPAISISDSNEVRERSAVQNLQVAEEQSSAESLQASEEGYLDFQQVLLKF